MANRLGECRPDKCFDRLLSAITPTTPQGGRLFVACSGGRDSLSLAFACWLLFNRGELTTLPTLLHVHHGMQAVNDEWADFVERWATLHDFPHHILRINLDKKTETHARDARYTALASVMTDGDVLLLAHHRDDQAETVLMRLINGAGVQGLSGMRAWQDKMVGGKIIKLYRPWLDVSRETITDFAKCHALPYVDDPTNDTGDNVRSFIRTDILPRLHAINPKAATNIARSASVLAQTATVVAELTAEQLARCLDDSQSQPPYQSVLLIDELLMLSVAQRSALLHAWLSTLGNDHAPSFAVVQDILALTARTDGDHQTQLVWQDRVICRYQNRLYAYRMDVWAFFGAGRRGVSGEILGQVGRLAVVWQGKNIDFAPLDRTTRLTLTHRKLTLSGKKLYQTLKIPPWLRDTLWVAYRDGVAVAVVAPCVAWALTAEQGGIGYHQARWQTLPLAKFCTDGTDGVQCLI